MLRSPIALYLFAALASLILSLWSWQQTALINKDGIFYIQAIQGDAESIEAIKYWLFYPYLIKAFAWLSHLDYEQAAYALNALLDLGIVLAFMHLVRTLGGDRHHLFWAAIIILSLPYLNDMRNEIIRDHGYWFFSLLALIAFYHWLQRQHWLHLGLWWLSMGLASLFRVEGLAFLVLLPLIHLWQRDWRHLGQALSLPLFIGIIALGYLWQQSIGYFWQDFIHQAWLTAQQKAEQLKQLFPQFTEDSIFPTLVFIVFYNIGHDLIKSSSWLYFLILVLKPYRFNSAAQKLIIAYALISLFLLLGQGLLHFIMVPRYTLALSLVLLLPVVFQMQSLQKSRYFALIVLGIIVLYGESLFKHRDDKVYFTRASEWAINHIPAGQTIITNYNTGRLAYLIAKKSDKRYQLYRYPTGLKQADYLFLRIKDNQPYPAVPLIQQFRLKERWRIRPEHGKGLVIYQVMD